MTAQMLFFNVFSEKDPHLNAVEQKFIIIKRHLKVYDMFFKIWDMRMDAIMNNAVYNGLKTLSDLLNDNMVEQHWAGKGR